MPRKVDDSIAITLKEMGQWQSAFEHFNTVLFDGMLRNDPIFTYQRKANSAGYFSADRFSSRVGESGRDEIALNPDAFIGRTDEQIASTLVHEMTHCWQKHHGKKPSARGYHNREWAVKMKELGLQPSSTGAVGGKETGQRMTHYIIPGPFAQTFAKLAAAGWKLNLQSAHRPGGTKAPKDRATYTCRHCGWNYWSKPNSLPICGPCILQAAPHLHELLREYITPERGATDVAVGLSYEPTAPVQVEIPLSYEPPPEGAGIDLERGVQSLADDGLTLLDGLDVPLPHPPTRSAAKDSG